MTDYRVMSQCELSLIIGIIDLGGVIGLLVLFCFILWEGRNT